MPVASMLMSSMSSGGGQGGGSGAVQGASNIAGGLLSGITGFFQRRAAKRMLKGLQRPEYTIPPEILKSQKMAEQAANEGLPAQQYSQAMQNIQRQQSKALSSATDRRGGLMALPGLQQQSNDALLNLDVKDAQARMANQQKLYGIYGQTAGYRDRAFQTNQMEPYQEKYGYAMNLLGQGNQNLLSGADKILGGTSQLAFGGNTNSSGYGQQGGQRKMAAGRTGQPVYYNGYNEGGNYSGFETPFPG